MVRAQVSYEYNLSLYFTLIFNIINQIIYKIDISFVANLVHCRMLKEADSVINCKSRLSLNVCRNLKCSHCRINWRYICSLSLYDFYLNKVQSIHIFCRSRRRYCRIPPGYNKGPPSNTKCHFSSIQRYTPLSSLYYFAGRTNCIV